jgi:SAM-dependent methyltransferase
MQGVDYEAWVDYVEEIVGCLAPSRGGGGARRASGGGIGSVVDLACGTGSSSIPWAARGYRTVAVDLSEEMLSLAREKALQRGLQISWLRQDLCSLKLETPVDLAVCFQDGFNYLLSREALRQAFGSVYDNLNRGGFLVFDLNYLPRIVASGKGGSRGADRDAGRDAGGEVNLAQGDGWSFSWSSSYQEALGIWEIEISGAVDGAQAGGAFSEKHRQRLHEPHEVWSLLAARGFTCLNSYRAFTFEQPHDLTPRVVFVAQKV